MPRGDNPERIDPNTSTRGRLLLIDGHSIAYRAFFALPVENFATTTGQPTNAVYGFTSMLINLLRDEQPTHVAVAFDVSRQSFRNETYAEYKANRSATPDEFKGQVSLIQEVLAALAIPVIQAEGYEADDVIATLATQASDKRSTSSSAPATATRSNWSSIGSPCCIRARASLTWPA